MGTRAQRSERIAVALSTAFSETELVTEHRADEIGSARFRTLGSGDDAARRSGYRPRGAAAAPGEPLRADAVGGEPGPGCLLRADPPRGRARRRRRGSGGPVHGSVDERVPGLRLQPGHPSAARSRARDRADALDDAVRASPHLSLGERGSPGTKAGCGKSACPAGWAKRRRRVRGIPRAVLSGAARSLALQELACLSPAGRLVQHDCHVGPRP